MRSVPVATASALAGLAGLHALWSTGSGWPCPDRAELAELVAGTERMPERAECLVVAGLLAAASGLVADVAPIPAAARTLGLGGVAVVLGGRGVAGVTGQTGRLVPWTPSDDFVGRDRRWFGPLCLLLAMGSLASLGSLRR